MKNALARAPIKDAKSESRHKKHRVSKPITAALCAMTLALTGCAKSASAVHTSEETYELTFATSHSATHPIGDSMVEPFLDEIRKNGPAVGLGLKYFPAGSMGDPSDILELMRTGAIDMGSLAPSNQTLELPLSSVSDLPGIANDQCLIGDVMLEMMSEGGIIREHELKSYGVTPMFMSVLPNYEYVTTGKKVEHPQDLRGLIIRSGGGIGDRLVSGAGAAGVALPGADTYEALSRGTIDGALFPTMSVTQYSLEEVTHYSTQGLNAMSPATGYAISDKAMNEMTQAQRDVVLSAARKAQQVGCSNLMEHASTASETMRAAGVEQVPVSEDVRREWLAIAEPIQGQWEQEINNRGLPGTEVLRQFKAKLAEAGDND